MCSMIMNTLQRRWPAVLAALAFVLVSAAGAAPEPAADPYGLPPGMAGHLERALEANYRLDFATARQELAAIESHREAHPMVAFGEVLTAWWRLTAAALEEDEARSKRLLELAEDCITQAEAVIEQGDPTGEGHLVKGATLGLLGRWHIKNHHWMKSYFVGKRAKAELERALEINPALADAWAGIGLYEYFVAKLPGIVRWVAFGGQTSDPAVGRAKIERAMAEGRFTIVGTKAALTLVYLRNEKDPARALATVDELIAAYPGSAFFHSLRLIALHDLGGVAGLVEEAAEQEALLAAGAFPPWRAAQVAFARGLAAFRAGEFEAARASLARAVAAEHPEDPFGTWARLYLGYLHDLAGERRAARAVYREVEDMTNRWGTKRLAKRYLDRPFDPARGDGRTLLPEI